MLVIQDGNIYYKNILTNSPIPACRLLRHVDSRNPRILHPLALPLIVILFIREKSGADNKLVVRAYGAVGVANDLDLAKAAEVLSGCRRVRERRFRL